MAYDSLMVFTGNANPRLAADVVRRLNISLGRATVGRFSDGEINVELLENVRGKDVFILQPTCSPTNDSVMELLIMTDALKRASAGRITAAIPYFGYARQDRRPRSARVPITAKVIANMLQAAGVQRVLTVDLHSDQIQGFFDIPVDNIYSTPILLGDIWKQHHQDLLVVSPDVGGVVRARALAKRIESDLAIIDKRRPKANVSEVSRSTARNACWPTVPTPCCRVRRSRASTIRNWTSWWSPTPSRCATMPAPAPRSARFRSRSCWPRPCCASATRNR